MKKFKAFNLVGVLSMMAVVVAIYLTGGFPRFVYGQNVPPTPYGEPLVATITPTTRPALAIEVTATTTPTVAAVATPVAYGEPRRVNFERGTYGTELKGQGAEQYILWAAQSQVMTIEFLTGSSVQAYLVISGQNEMLPMTSERSKATINLPATGDYILRAAGDGEFTFKVEIR